MTPSQLQPAQFAAYPPLARRTAVEHLPVLRELPGSFVPFLLKETINLDWKFPAEREELLAQLDYLKELPPSQREHEMQPFAQLRLSPALEGFNSVDAPGQFLEQLSAHLWATAQMDSFRAASERYMQQFRAVHTDPTPPVSRLAIVLMGQQVSAAHQPLFQKLRREGVYFSQVSARDGVAELTRLLEQRAAAHPEPYAHWLVTGAEAHITHRNISVLSYQDLFPVRTALTTRIKQAFEARTSPELLRTALAETTPAALGMKTDPQSELLDRFKVNLFTEGSGTQIYSTTFVQWSSREVLRRAKPLTLIARFTPRRQETSMSELLSGSSQATLDPAGSLVDADMGAWYTWLSLQRLTGADQSCFLTWFEGHQEAVAVGPQFPRGTVNNAPILMAEILQKLAAPSAMAH